MPAEITDVRSVVVTGASGFVGSRLCRVLLDQGWAVHALHLPDCNLSYLPDHPYLHLHPTRGEVGELRAILGQATPLLVVHLASLFLSEHCPENVADLVDSNVKFGSAVLEAMSQIGANRFVNTGTSWQHYQDAPYDPVNLYAATKQAFEDILTYYVKARAFRAVTLKLFDTYGPGDPRPKLMNLLLRAAQTGEPLALSPGEQLLDVVHVNDVCRAFILAIDVVLQQVGSQHQSFAVSSGHLLSLRDLVNTFNRVAGCQIPVLWGSRPYRPREVMTPWSKGELLPGWQPLTGLVEGLRELLTSATNHNDGTTRPTGPQ